MSYLMSFFMLKKMSFYVILNVLFHVLFFFKKNERELPQGFF